MRTVLAPSPLRPLARSASIRLTAPRPRRSGHLARPARRLPSRLGPTRTPSADQAIWDEYGFRKAKTAQYEGDGEKFTATAWRFQDPTGAMGPSSGCARRIPNHPRSPNWPPNIHRQHPGAWQLRAAFRRLPPGAPFLTTVIQGLKQVDNSALPTLMNYLPSQDLVPNSERYVEGPAALQKFDPGIPPSTAAFHLSAEAQVGSFQCPRRRPETGHFQLSDAPDRPQQTAQFQQIAGAMVKRSGPWWP
jgi:hypothetical protein